MATAERRRLDALVVPTHAQAGLLAFNLADRAAARRYFATAQSVADDAGDDTLRTQAHAMARQLDTRLPPVAAEATCVAPSPGCVRRFTMRDGPTL